MNRVEAAINQGRCVLAIGGRAIQNPDILVELRRRAVPTVVLGSDPVNPARKLSSDTLAPALQQGGIIVLVEPEGAQDGRALTELAEIVQQTSAKPALVVAAKAFNPFAMPMSMRLLKLEQVKSRAQDFLASLPIPDAPAAFARPAAAAAPSSPFAALAGQSAAAPSGGKDADKSQAPRPDFAGREDEIAKLRELLAEDGSPVVIAGPSGSGRRWLVEHALSGTELKRLPDFVISRGSGADTLLARVALAAKEAGDSTLHGILDAARKRPQDTPTPQAMADAFVAAISSDALAGKVLTIHHLHRLLDRRDNSFYREGRLELMLRGALLASPKLRILITSERAPTFYREGQSSHLRVLQLAGIRGRELHALFAAWHAPEFPRDRFGQISDRTHGHPVYARQLALAVREGGDVDDLLERPRFLKASALGDLEPLQKHLQKRVQKLAETDATLLQKLSTIAMLPAPAGLGSLQELGITRKDRLALLALGLLEQTPHADNRKYYVHPLVAEHLDSRMVYDFDQMERVAGLFFARAKAIDKDKPVHALARRQDANRLLIEARRTRDRQNLPYPDADPIVEDVEGIVRRKTPRYDIARMRLNEAMKIAPMNPELLLVEAELRVAEKRKVEEVEEIYNRIAAEMPTPEAVHHEASYHLARNARGKALGALERGVALFPESGRIRRRLAGLYLRQGKPDQAMDALIAARDIEPMMPDNYSMLGEVYVQLGASRWEEADQVLQEARRLDATNPVHMARAATLLRARAVVEPDRRDELLQQAEEVLQEALKLEPTSTRVMTALATVIIDRGGDLEQANWMLKKALKRNETAELLTQRARLLIKQNTFDEGGKLLDRAFKKEPAYYPAYAVRGDLFRAQGDIFKAIEAYKIARERSPTNATERVLYDAALAELSTIIESGRAAEFMSAAGDAGADNAGSPQAGGGSPGPRREPGRTTVRRTRGGAIVDVADAAAAATASSMTSADPTTSGASPDDADDAADPTAAGYDAAVHGDSAGGDREIEHGGTDADLVAVDVAENALADEILSGAEPPEEIDAESVTAEDVLDEDALTEETRNEGPAFRSTAIDELLDAEAGPASDDLADEDLGQTAPSEEASDEDAGA